MRTDHPHLLLSATLVFMVLAAPSYAQKSDERSDAQETEEAALPEHRVRPLPVDTFKPSEEISEDFAVPFPVDI